ncbi:MAG TPA: hypothetical protein VFQ24_03455 [Terriglobia bacterium]|nr:hypothetical protein [Terriglobia bacterium]
MNYGAGEQIVDIEDPLTWPGALCNVLTNSKDVLSDYEARMREVDRIPGERFRFPKSEIADGRRKVVERANVFVAAARILGFHCTRLLPYEAESVRQEGLKLSSPEFLRDRIERAVKEDHLPRALADALLEKNQADDPNRLGMVGFVNARSLLKNVSCVHRFFESWGGEGLYNSHEDDHITGPVLKQIGEPHVVVAALPAKALHTGSELGEYFINAFLRSIGLRTKGYAEFESYVTKPVSKEQILAVIGSSDWRFTLLTGDALCG